MMTPATPSVPFPWNPVLSPTLRNHSPTHSPTMLRLRRGFLRSILLCLRLEEGGLANAGPPCGSFVFINLATSGRRLWCPFGNARERPYVRTANLNLVFIMLRDPLLTIKQTYGGMYAAVISCMWYLCNLEMLHSFASTILWSSLWNFSLIWGMGC